MRNRTLAIVALFAALAVSAAVQAQYPDRPIRLVVPLAAGGGTDVVARTLVAPAMGAALGQPIVVENLTGAGGQLAYEAVSRAKPDGHTWLISSFAVTTLRFTSSSYTLDAVGDFAPVTKVEAGLSYIVVNRDLPAKSIPEFVAYAKANPGKVNYGAGGTLGIRK